MRIMTLLAFSALLSAGPAMGAQTLRFAPMPLEKPDEILTLPAIPALQQAPSPQDTSCVARLARKAIIAKKATPLVTQPACAVDDAVQLISVRLSGDETVDLPDRPVIACTMAEQFGAFVQGPLAAKVKDQFAVVPQAIGTGPGHECRSRNRVAGAKLSAHATGLAIDMAWIKLEKTRIVSVEKPVDASESRFWHLVQAAACGPMTTVLGPQADAAHKNHIHLDREKRGRDGNTTYCR